MDFVSSGIENHHYRILQFFRRHDPPFWAKLRETVRHVKPLLRGLAKLPILPESAIRGLPASTELFTVGVRRFYAYTAALAGERSWVIVVHAGWRLGEQWVRHIIQAG